MKHALILLALLFSPFASAQPEQDVYELLSEMHEATKAADHETYFGMFTDDAVFFGTDIWERWTKEEFVTLYKPYMESGQGWWFEMHMRRVDVQPCGTIALFDEVLYSESYGICRSSGTARLEDGDWAMVRYHLDITVPNEVVTEVVPINRNGSRGVIRTMHIQREDATLKEIGSVLNATKPDLAVIAGVTLEEYNELQGIVDATHLPVGSSMPPLLVLQRGSGFIKGGIESPESNGVSMTQINFCCDLGSYRFAVVQDDLDPLIEKELNDSLSDGWVDFLFYSDRVMPATELTTVEMELDTVAGIKVHRGLIKITESVVAEQQSE
ncbi:MAG: hypothetical protein COB69_06045 [Phycisphaera sp.]|nr:MAG: hypothetical protein COB69_06045 [Phycisphaera sp.]